MANNSITGIPALDARLQQQQRNFSMFNPTDAYASFTSQVANTPNWWESLARAATAPLFITGLKMYNKYTSPKKDEPPPPTINSDAINKAFKAVADKELNIPQLWANFGQDYIDPYGNKFTQQEIQQPWTADFNERLNPTSKWNNPLIASIQRQKQDPLGLGNFNFNNQPTQTPTTATTPAPDINPTYNNVLYTLKNPANENNAVKITGGNLLGSTFPEGYTVSPKRTTSNFGNWNPTTENLTFGTNWQQGWNPSNLNDFDVNEYFKLIGR